MEGLKFDSDKPNWALLPLELVEEAVRVLTFGAKKYAPNNWQLVDDGEDRYFAALMRHLSEYQKGVDVDPDSNELHLSHALCNVLFLLHFHKEKVNTEKYKISFSKEDRFKDKK